MAKVSIILLHRGFKVGQLGMHITAQISAANLVSARAAADGSNSAGVRRGVI